MKTLMKTTRYQIFAFVLASALLGPAAAQAAVREQSLAAFGTSVAVDGGFMAVGAPYSTSATNSGVVKVFDSTSGALLYVLASPSPAAGDSFGNSVAISGTRVVASAPGWFGANRFGSAYVYDLSGATPTVPVATLNNPVPVTEDHFGWSVAISGTRVVVGSHFDDIGATDAGSAYVYELSSATPSVPVATLNNPGPAAGDFFGLAVAISGTRVVVGAYSDDTGASGAGSAYVYDLSGATPTVPVRTLNNPGPEAGDAFGFSVAISGTRVVVGVPNDYTGAVGAGIAYVYDLASATPTVPVRTLNNPDSGPAAGDRFGNSVAIFGTRVVVGARGDDAGAFNSGSAYVYDLSGGTPTVPVATLNNPNPAAGDYFGWSVAISGTRVVVGASQDDTVALDAGSAYVYDLNGATPTVPVTTLNNLDPAAAGNPCLALVRSGLNVVLSWPTNAPGYTLQSATNLIAPVTWIDSTVAPSIVGTQFTLTNTTSASRQFFRLKK